MVKLGQTSRGTNHGFKYLWLVKNMQVFRNYDKKACYEVLAFNGNGWFALYSGTLVDCKKFIGNEEIVESLEDDTKLETSAPEATEEPEAPEATEEPESTEEPEEPEEPEAPEATEEPESTEEPEEPEAPEAPEVTSEPEATEEIDGKHHIYLSVYRDLQQTLTHLRKCKTPRTYDICVGRYIRKFRKMYSEKKISKSMLSFIESKISMQNAESGIWASEYERATGYHKSRRYNKNRVDS